MKASFARHKTMEGNGVSTGHPVEAPLFELMTATLHVPVWVIFHEAEAIANGQTERQQERGETGGEGNCT